VSDPVDISLALPPDGLDPIHDVLVCLSLEENPDAAGAFSQEELLEVWMAIPRNLRLDAHKWGVGDTEVRDNIYVFLKEQRVK
jgi:hypothetical protein